MDFARLNIFAECVAQGSFSKAARALDLDPSQVSRAVSALEQDLGVRLFERSTRRIALTEAGGLYHGRVAPILTELAGAAEAARDLTSAPRGHLRVAASTAFGARVIAPMLKDFLGAYPEIDVTLLLDDAPVDLLKDRIDLAVRLVPEALPDTVVSKLCRTRYRVVAASGTVEVEHPSELEHIPVLRFAYPGFRDLWRFRSSDQIIEVPVSGRVEMTGAAALLTAARAGLGPALLADWLVARDLASGRLVDLLPEFEATATSFDTGAWILQPSLQYQPQKTRVFIEALRGWVKSRLIPVEKSISGN